MAENTFSNVPIVHQLLPYPISRQEAELHWERARQKVRARIAALPSSSFERTMLEEDERFYATFPLARQAAVNAWIEQEFPYAQWDQPPSFFTREDTPMDTSFDGSPKPFTSMSTSVHAPTPVPDFSTFTLANALTFSPSPRLEVLVHRPLTILYNTSAKVTERDPNATSHDYVPHNRAGSSQGCDPSCSPEIVPEPCSMQTPPRKETVLFALEVLAPARRTRPARNTRKANLRPPPYTPTNNQENVYPSTFFATPPESIRTSTPALPPNEKPQYTGDWEVDAIAANENLHTSERMHTAETPALSILPPPLKKSNNPDASSTRVQPLSPRKCHLSPRSRSRPNPYTPPKPASGVQLTSLAPRKRAKLLRDKDGKPIMACLFCRGRKIACGPPPEGSDDPTCNQCARRGLACHYPTESRRGQRKKKTDIVNDIVNAKSNDASNLLNLYRDATLKDHVFHVTSDDSDSEWDIRDF